MRHLPERPGNGRPGNLRWRRQSGKDAPMSLAPQPPARLDIISDVICPWCYIGKRQVERALPLLAGEGLDFTVHWHAFQLNPDMPVAGVGLAFRTDLMRRTPNTVAAHRVIWLAERHGVQDAVVEALFRGYFIEG